MLVDTYSAVHSRDGWSEDLILQGLLQGLVPKASGFSTKPKTKE